MTISKVSPGDFVQMRVSEDDMMEGRPGAKALVGEPEFEGSKIISLLVLNDGDRYPFDCECGIEDIERLLEPHEVPEALARYGQ